MPENLRALIVVLTLAIPAFYIGRQLATSVISSRDFAVWRNVWFAVTIAEFLSPNFFVFALFEIPVCLYARRANALAPALFMILLLAVPVVDIPIGGFGIFNSLADANNARLLAVILLLPFILTTRRTMRSANTFFLPDWIILSYVLLQAVLESQNGTQFARAITTQLLDVLIPYFTFSRYVTAIDVRKIFLAFIIAIMPLALIGVFETIKGWLLYSSFIFEWRGDLMMRYLFRDNILRANATTASSIVLGFIIMVALGCLIAVQQDTKSRTYTRIAFAVLFAGLVAALARGPWVGTLALVVVYIGISPGAFINLTKWAAFGAMGLFFLLLTPFGSRLLNFLPFIGSIDAGSVTYRQMLFDNAMLVIERNPWFGSRDFLLTPEMQEMLQGQHIIDVVNTYLSVALKSGLIGLGIFLAFFGTILFGLSRVVKFDAVKSDSLSQYARASIAILIAIMVTIGTVSSIDYVPHVYWSFAGLGVAIIRIAYRQRAVLVRAAAVQTRS